MTAVEIATWIVRAGALYGAIGLVTAIFLLAGGLRRLDPAAAQGGPGFKLLILPGMIALWPFLLRRYARGPARERNAHDLAAAGDGE
jgi:hypothetical protein